MPAFKDLTGQMFNNWKVVGFSHFDKHRASHWVCECQCQYKTQKVMNIQVLKKSQDCGCSKEIDLTGQKIGRWMVIGRVEDTSYLSFPRKTWHCICECGTNRDQNWLAQIKYNYKRYFLGYYDKFEDAVKARLNAELQYFGMELAPQRHLFEQYGIVPRNDCEVTK